MSTVVAPHPPSIHAAEFLKDDPVITQAEFKHLGREVTRSQRPPSGQSAYRIRHFHHSRYFSDG